MRTALLTGANRGIGLAIAAGLNRVTGIKVLLGSRRQEDGEKRRHWAQTPLPCHWTFPRRKRSESTSRTSSLQ